MDEKKLSTTAIQPTNTTIQKPPTKTSGLAIAALKKLTNQKLAIGPAEISGLRDENKNSDKNSQNHCNDIEALIGFCKLVCKFHLCLFDCVL